MKQEDECFASTSDDDIATDFSTFIAQQFYKAGESPNYNINEKNTLVLKNMKTLTAADDSKVDHVETLDSIQNHSSSNNEIEYTRGISPTTSKKQDNDGHEGHVSSSDDKEKSLNLKKKLHRRPVSKSLSNPYIWKNIFLVLNPYYNKCNSYYHFLETDIWRKIFAKQNDKISSHKTGTIVKNPYYNIFKKNQRTGIGHSLSESSSTKLRH